uniref:Uncharacterized protein LOC100369615 n=1 Tax=Saccoglossus kowalevskii TaxID=10224 RepID=A0ABM0GP41_SACKO|nr:PREDICTED: uncharacterized protein LOC100369615 [Saccoglossus kowalevskii]
MESSHLQAATVLLQETGKQVSEKDKTLVQNCLSLYLPYGVEKTQVERNLFTGHLLKKVDGTYLVEPCHQEKVDTSENEDISIITKKGISFSSLNVGFNRQIAEEIEQETAHVHTFMPGNGMNLLVIDFSDEHDSTFTHNNINNGDEKQFCRKGTIVKAFVQNWINSLHAQMAKSGLDCNVVKPSVNVQSARGKLESIQEDLSTVINKREQDIRQLLKTEMKESAKNCPENGHIIFAISSHPSQINKPHNETADLKKNKLEELLKKHSNKIPGKWLKLEVLLKLKERPVMELADVYTVGCELNLSPEEVDDALLWLYSLRDIIHFADDRELRNTVIINPRWLIDLIKLFATETSMYQKVEAYRMVSPLCEILYKHGILDTQLIYEILGRCGRAEDGRILLKALLMFEIIYPFPCKKEITSYYMPCLLKTIDQSGMLFPVNTIQGPSLYYHFDGGCLPDGIFHQLIVRCLEYWPQAELFRNVAKFEINDHHYLLVSKRECDIELAVVATPKKRGEVAHLRKSFCTEIRECVDMILKVLVKRYNSIVSYKSCLKCDHKLHTEEAITSGKPGIDDGCITADCNNGNGYFCLHQSHIDVTDLWYPKSTASRDLGLHSKMRHEGDELCMTYYEKTKVITSDDIPTIGIVTALDCEYIAMSFMFTKSLKTYIGNQPIGDLNRYKLGSIGNKTIVITSLPVGMTGEEVSAVTATRLCDVFPSVKILYMVGIAGGVPNIQYDEEKAIQSIKYIRPHVREGDVIVAYPVKDSSPGFIQYDYGKIVSDIASENLKGNIKRQTQIRLSPEGLSAAREIKNEFETHQSKPWIKTIENILRNRNKVNRLNQIRFQRPTDEERITASRIQHPEENILRSPGEPKVHFGILASANSVMRNSEIRDKLAEAENIIGFEMENAGIAVATSLSSKECMFVRGVCDYSDEFKDKAWQYYASLAAAAVAKCLIEKLK